MRVVLALALVMVAGCQETVHCGPGSYGRDCTQFLSNPLDGSGHDGGIMDSGEADVDAFIEPDAGPCGTGCPATLQCYLGSDAGDAGQAPGCVQCVTRDDCMGRDAGPPTDGGGGGTYVCRDFLCVFGCETSADCGGNVCRADHTCSVHGTTQGLCAPCDTDGNCAAGRLCAGSVSLGPETGYCLDVTMCAARVYRTMVSMPSIDEVPSAFCFPPATCEALGDAASTSCGSDDVCGADGVADGYCPPGGRPDPSVCSYRCSGNLDCFDGQVCEASAPRYCRSCIPADSCP